MTNAATEILQTVAVDSITFAQKSLASVVVVAMAFTKKGIMSCAPRTY
jgi:hypothetical protein